MNSTKTITPSANGRRRPQLADSISRLDSILDGLAEAIPATVADAVRETVKAAVTELLSDPDVLAALAARLPVQQVTPVPEAELTHAQPQKPTKPKGQRSWLALLRAGWYRAVAWTGERVSAARQWCCGLWERLRAIAGLAWEVRGSLGIGLVAGAGIGVLAYCAGPLLASILCALAVSTLTTTSILIVPVLRLLALCGRGDG